MKLQVRPLRSGRSRPRRPPLPAPGGEEAPPLLLFASSPGGQVAAGVASVLAVLCANLIWLDHFRLAASLVYSIGVVVAARFGGLRGGLTATFLSLCANAYINMLPVGMEVEDPEDRVRLWQFAGLGVVISYLSEQVRRHLWQIADRERQLRQVHTALERRVQDIEEFSHAVSHDLRGPLRTIEGFSEMLLQRASGRLRPEERALLERMAKAAWGMDGLIQDVLAFGRAVRMPLRPAAVDLNFLVEDVLASYPTPGASVRVCGPLAPVLGSEGLLTQVLAQLISNAVKFVPEGRRPEVEITTERRGGRVLLTVQDNGIGVPEEFRRKIFQPFERIPGPVPREGRGMGLAIVKKAVERMDGRVGVESEGGRGSRFWVDLPAA